MIFLKFKPMFKLKQNRKEISIFTLAKWAKSDHAAHACSSHTAWPVQLARPVSDWASPRGVAQSARNARSGAVAACKARGMA
jgi:hypothetical protein